MYKYIDQGGDTEFPEELRQLGISEETQDKKSIFVQEIQRMRRGIILTGQLKEPDSKLEREVLVVEGRFNAGRFRRSGTDLSIDSLVNRYYQEQKEGKIAKLPDRYKMGSFDMELVVNFEVSKAAVDQANVLLDQAGRALDHVDEPIERVISEENRILRTRIEEKMESMSSQLEVEESNVQSRVDRIKSLIQQLGEVSREGEKLKILEELGLNNYESTVYLYLADGRGSEATKIGEETGLDRVELKRALAGLVKKEFIVKESGETSTTYQANSLDVVADNTEELERRRSSYILENMRRGIEAYSLLLERLEEYQNIVARINQESEDKQELLKVLVGLSNFQGEVDKETINISDLRNQVLQQYLKLFLNFETKYSSKGDPLLSDVKSITTMLHAFENDHDIGISHDLREEIGGLVDDRQIDMSVISTLAEFVNITIKEHSLEITNLTARQKQGVIRTLNINSLRECIENYSRAKAVGKKRITCIPTRGAIAELSGDLADACWVRTANIMRDNPNMVAVIFVEDIDNPQRTRSIGSCLIIDTTVDGEPAIVMRGLNPRQELFDRGGSPVSFLKEFVDGFLLDLARKTGKEKSARKVRIVAPKAGTGALSNRPAFKLDSTFREVVTGGDVILDEPNSFNGYNISERCFLIKEIEINPEAQEDQTLIVSR